MALFKAGGGGYLNGVDGVIVDYQFGTKDWPAKTRGKDGYTTLSVELHVQQDGVEGISQTFIPAGFFYPESQSVSDDGHLLESDDDSPIIREDTEFAGFIGSLIEKGFPEALFPENGRDFRPMIGARLRFLKVVDKEATEKFGKRKDKKDPKKSYNRDLLRVGEVLAMPEAGGKVKKAGKKAAPTPLAKAAKGKKAAAAPVDTEAADLVIVELLADAKDNTIARGTVSSLVVRYALKNKIAAEEREVLRKQLASVDYLTDAAERGIVSFDADDKKEMIGVAE